MLDIYIFNSRELYWMMMSIAKCIAKKQAKGVTPSIEYLANCPTVYNIVRCGVTMLYESDGINATRQEKKEARYTVARYIINECLPFV